MHKRDFSFSHIKLIIRIFLNGDFLDGEHALKVFKQEADTLKLSRRGA